jgi:hypothetical protein
VTAEEIVEAIWQRWERDLGDWELEGATANRKAKRLAVDEVAGLLAAETGGLRAALFEQWQHNHAEHCSSEWPHPEGKTCYWPGPEAPPPGAAQNEAGWWEMPPR